VRLDAYTIVVLRRPANAPQLSGSELDRLQREDIPFNARIVHLAVAVGDIGGSPGATIDED